MSLISNYLTELRAKLATGDATEHTHRPALQRLLGELQAGLTVINEPRHTEAGAVDFIVKRKEQPIGWLEAKDIGVDLGPVAKGEQLKRYLGAYPNLILTDYVTFRLYVNGKMVEDASLGVVDGTHITSTIEKQTAVEKLLTTFLSQEVYRPGKPEDLARRMAYFARMAEAAIIGALKTEGERGQLHSQMAAFRETLLPDLSEEQFADMYAQTIAYGLFAAKCHHPQGDDFSRWTAAKYLPPTNPFLQRLFHELTGPDLDPEVEWVVDGLVSLLRHTDMSAIVDAFAKHQQGREDPVVHFYETFLKEYNPKERKIRGVYYTPEPVVSYIVRSVDHLLKTEFDKPLGLADDSVFILDPACGTGTFLYFVIEHIHRTVTKDGRDKGAWPGYVREKLLQRLFGFELLMAPYTIAHLKLAQLLHEQGYDFPDDQRLGIYLTNTLEEARFKSETLVQRYISEEAEAAAEVKRDKPIMVVLGNPPYSKSSANQGAWIEAQMEAYKGTVRDQETQIQALSDDYVKFLRFAHWRIEQTGRGLIGMITNNGYLDGPIFRDMRQSLAQTFSDIRVVNLHGDVRKRAEVPVGVSDKNVFDIQQGVAIALLARTTRPPVVLYRDIWGTRQDKYDQLEANDVGASGWLELAPVVPHYLFTPFAVPASAEEDWHLLDIFGSGRRDKDAHNAYGAGFVTQQDQFAVAFDGDTLLDNVRYLCAETTTEADIRSRFRMCTTSQWDWTAARKELPTAVSELTATRCLYRPFDHRHTIFNRHVCTILRERIMRHLERDNLALLTTRRVTRLPFDNVYVADQPVEYKAASHDRNTQVFPLYLYEEGNTLYEGQTRRPNLAPAFVAELAGRLSLTFIEDGRGDLTTTFGPEDVFHYLYAVLHSPTYRSRYAEFLKIDFPRIPLTSSLELFRRLCELGAELVALHLLKSPLVCDSPATYPEKGSDLVETVRYDDANRRVYINKTQYFGGIEPALYEFQVGGYQVMNKWLKDRKGRTLSYDDIQHYQQVAAALTHTRRLMQEIDAAIPEWPLQ